MYVKIKKNPLKVPSKGAPFYVPPTGSLWREMLRPQGQWFIHSFIFVGVPKKEPSHEMRRKHTVIVHGAPPERKSYIQCGTAWFLQGIVNDTAVTTPVPCSLQHNTLHIGLGGPKPISLCVVVTLIRVYPSHLLPPPT